MHGYAGDPLVYPITISIYDDADLNPAVAANLDTPLQNLADRTAFQQADKGARAAENWQAPFSLGTGVLSECKPSWDSQKNAWCIGWNHSSHIAIASYFGLAGSATTALYAGGAFPLGVTISFVGRVTCVLKDPSDEITYYIAAVKTSDGTGHIWRLNIVTGVYTSILVTGAAVTDIQLGYFNGTLVEVSAASSGVDAMSYSTNQGASFTPIAASVLDCDTTWSLVVSQGQMLAVANHLLSTGEPGLMSSPDGQVFTAQSFGGFFSTGDKGIGTAWGNDQSGPCWIFCFAPAASSGSTRRFLRSADAITWTDVGTTLTQTPLWDMVAIGNTFVGILGINSLGVQVGANVVYSVSGGVLWYRSQLATPVASPLLGSGQQGLWLGAGNAQFAATLPNVGAADSSLAFSFIQGTAGVEVF